MSTLLIRIISNYNAIIVLLTYLFNIINNIYYNRILRYYIL